MVVGRQVRSQQPSRREVDGSVLEPLQHDRKAASGSSHADAVVSLLLGEPQHVAAVGEERAVTEPVVDVPRVELGEVGHDLDHAATFAGDEVPDARDELVVGEPANRREDLRLHGSLYRAHRSGGPKPARAPRDRLPDDGERAPRPAPRKPTQLFSSLRTASATALPLRIAAARATCWIASSIASAPAPRSMSARARR